MSMSDIEKVPFFEKSHDVKEESWGGAENKVSSIAFNLPENIDRKNIEYTHVLKEPRGLNYFDVLAEKYPPTSEEEKQAIKELSDYFNSKEHFFNTQKDYRTMGEIFGDALPETQFILGEPREGNPLGFYILQEKINGETWTKYSAKKSSEENQEFMMKHRCQLMGLIGGARKSLVELGAAVDIWGDNIMVDGQENIKLIDPGSPSELERHFDALLKLPKDMRTLLANNFLLRLNDLEKYPSSIGMTSEEIESMNKTAGITDEEYENAKKQLRERCERLLQ